MKFRIVAAVFGASTLSACASSYVMTPYPTEGQTVRYLQGQPTIYAEGQNSSIQVTPLAPNEKSRLLFSVAVLNRSDVQQNFGVENIDLEADGAEVRVFTVPELERMAKNDATISMVAIALAGGASAYAASAGPTSTTTVVGPSGVYRAETTNRALQSLATTAAAANTAQNMNIVAASLDATLQNLGANVLQTTTIDSGSSFGGQVVGDRVSVPSEGELDTSLLIQFAGDSYRVRFGIGKTQ